MSRVGVCRAALPTRCRDASRALCGRPCCSPEPFLLRVPTWCSRARTGSSWRLPRHSRSSSIRPRRRRSACCDLSGFAAVDDPAIGLRGSRGRLRSVALDLRPRADCFVRRTSRRLGFSAGSSARTVVSTCSSELPSRLVVSRRFGVSRRGAVRLISRAAVGGLRSRRPSRCERRCALSFVLVPPALPFCCCWSGPGRVPGGRSGDCRSAPLRGRCPAPPVASPLSSPPRSRAPAFVLGVAAAASCCRVDLLYGVQFRSALLYVIRIVTFALRADLLGVCVRRLCSTCCRLLPPRFRGCCRSTAKLVRGGGAGLVAVPYSDGRAWFGTACDEVFVSTRWARPWRCRDRRRSGFRVGAEALYASLADGVRARGAALRSSVLESGLRAFVRSSPNVRVVPALRLRASRFGLPLRALGGMSSTS